MNQIILATCSPTVTPVQQPQTKQKQPHSNLAQTPTDGQTLFTNRAWKGTLPQPNPNGLNLDHTPLLSPQVLHFQKPYASPCPLHKQAPYKLTLLLELSSHSNSHPNQKQMMVHMPGTRPSLQYHQPLKQVLDQPTPQIHNWVSRGYKYFTQQLQAEKKQAKLCTHNI